MALTPPPRRYLHVLRFDRTERWFHWALAIPMLVAILSGLALYFPGLEKLMGNREIARDVHRLFGFGAVILPVAVLALRDRGSLREDLGVIDNWSADDRLWLRLWVRRKFGFRNQLPPQGRFNAGQKFNAILTGAALFWLTVTGVLLFPGIRPPFWLVTNARSLHDLAWFLLVPAVAGHIFLAAVYPPTRPGVWGAINGRVRLDWLRHHHPLAPEVTKQPPT